MAQKRLKFWGLLGGLLLIPCNTAMSQCSIPDMLMGDFTYPDVRKPWYAKGTFSINRATPPGTPGTINGTIKLARNAPSNLPAEWSDIHQTVSLLANKEYALTASVRTSSNVREGYMGFFVGMGLPKVEQKFGPLPTLKTLTVKFKPLRAGSYDVFIGYWARERASNSLAPWLDYIEFGDLRLEALFGGCVDVITQPGK